MEVQNLNHQSSISSSEIDGLLSPATATKRGTIKGSDSITIDSDGTANAKRYYRHMVEVYIEDDTVRFDVNFISSRQTPYDLQSLKEYIDSQGGQVACSANCNIFRELIRIHTRNNEVRAEGFYAQGGAVFSAAVRFGKGKVYDL